MAGIVVRNLRSSEFFCAFSFDQIEFFLFFKRPLKRKHIEFLIQYMFICQEKILSAIIHWTFSIIHYRITYFCSVIDYNPWLANHYSFIYKNNDVFICLSVWYWCLPWCWTEDNLFTPCLRLWHIKTIATL